MTPREAISPDWTDLLETGPVTLGHDVGTTTKGTSNPSTLAVMERTATLYIVRLMLAWKTEDPDVSRQIIECVLADLAAVERRAKALVIDASNEVFNARTLRKSLRSRVPVHLVKGGEKLRYKGEEMDAKTLLGNLYINHLDDGFIALPPGAWITDDHRLVKKERGGFQTDTGKSGQHGDTFDAGKLALWGHLRGSAGTSQGIEAIRVGGGLGKAHDARNTIQAVHNGRVLYDLLMDQRGGRGGNLLT